MKKKIIKDIKLHFLEKKVVLNGQSLWTLIPQNTNICIHDNKWKGKRKKIRNSQGNSLQNKIFHKN